MSDARKRPVRPGLGLGRIGRASYFYVGVFSLFINVLMLVPALYMLQLYDRVLTSRSEPTLWMLTLIVIALLATMGMLEWLRARILVRVGVRFDNALSGPLFDALFRQANHRPEKATAQPLTDLLQLRQFLTGQGLFALFDAPWVPIYIGVLYLFHPAFGHFALGAAVILLLLTYVNGKLTRKPLEQSNNLHSQALALVGANLRNAEVVHAMGMQEALRERWRDKHHEFLAMQATASDRAGTWTNASKNMRLLFQSLILGLGAYLAIRMEVTPGMMVAASIVMGRALAPLDLLIGSWRGFITARQAQARISALLESYPGQESPMPLPPPKGRVALEGAFLAPPGSSAHSLRNVTLTVEPGEVVGVIGASAAGKSSLVRAMLGVWPLSAGKSRIDGADIGQWDRGQLGAYVGYLPQDIELFEGSVAENIARFGEVDPEKVVAAAQLAGVHELILRLPQGYATVVGPGGGTLSGGQRQRIALARAVYGNPSLVVLDEPNSNLDDQGERALATAIAALKERATTVIVVTHRANLLGVADKILLMHEGAVSAYGKRNEILSLLAHAGQAQGVEQRTNAMQSA